MTTHDTKDYPGARLSELKPGDEVELDAGFTCAPAGKITVQSDEHGLWFACSEGHHYLEGQAPDGEHCVGVYRVRP